MSKVLAKQIAAKKKLLEALERTLGIVTPACKEAGVSRDTFYKYYREDPVFKAQVDDINEITLDFVENQLLKCIKEGNHQSIAFYMKYKAKHRGYRDTLDITGDITVRNIEVSIKNGSENRSD